MRFLRRRKEDRCRSEFKRGYAEGRASKSWTLGRVKPEESPRYRGWNLGQRVTRRLAIIEDERVVGIGDRVRHIVSRGLGVITDIKCDVQDPYCLVWVHFDGETVPYPVNPDNLEREAKQ